MSCPADPQSWGQTQAFLTTVGNVPGLDAVVVPDQGHDVPTWTRQLPTALPFLPAQDRRSRVVASPHHS